MKYSLIVMAFLTLVAGNPHRLNAQTGVQPPTLQPNQRPTTSPYLSLPGGRNTPAIEYFRQIRPQQQLRAATQAQSRAIRDLQQEVRGIQRISPVEAPTTSIGATGHPTSFFTYGSYFGSDPRGGRLQPRTR